VLAGIRVQQAMEAAAAVLVVIERLQVRLCLPELSIQQLLAAAAHTPRQTELTLAFLATHLQAAALAEVAIMEMGQVEALAAVNQ